MAATVGGALALGLCAAPASADPNVVKAVVFTGSQANSGTRTVPLSTLESCPPYQGPTTITLHPTGQPVGVPFDSSWTLATVLQCGLSIQPSDVTGLVVVGGTGTPENKLSSAQLTDASAYPGSGGALPTISLQESNGLIQYVRPWLGGSDNNATDQFSVQADPISIIVFENQAQLVVTPAQPAAVAKSQTKTSERFKLGANVTTADGATVSPSDLSWSWNINGSRVSSDATPTLKFMAPSRTPVSVLVTDTATGTGGTTTFDVVAQSGRPPSGKKNKPGSGDHKRGNPTGGQGNPKGRGTTAPKRSHDQPTTTNHTHDNSHNGSHKGHRTHSTQPSAPATTQPATSTPAPPATPTTTPGLTPVNGGTRPPPRHHRSVHHRAHHHRASGSPHRSSGGGTSGAHQRVVTGRLVADLNPASASSSELVRGAGSREAPAPLVHAAATSMSLPAWLYGALGVMVLLAGGATYERRGRRARSLHR